MRWPLVWRSTAETAFRNESERAAWAEKMAECANDRVAEHRAAYTRVLDRAEEEYRRAEARYADLMASYRTLRQQGFATPPPEPVATPAEKPDPVLAAINTASAGKDAKVRAGMLRQVAIDRKADLTDVEIVQRIYRGNRPAEEIA